MGDSIKSPLNGVYAVELSSLRGFPTDLEIYPICGDRAVKQINDWDAAAAAAVADSLEGPVSPSS